jgi:hypothetical protein
MKGVRIFLLHARAARPERATLHMALREKAQRSPPVIRAAAGSGDREHHKPARQVLGAPEQAFRNAGAAERRMPPASPASTALLKRKQQRTL